MLRLSNDRKIRPTASFLRWNGSMLRLRVAAPPLQADFLSHAEFPEVSFLVTHTNRVLSRMSELGLLRTICDI